jgi:hypothetical protein
VAGFDHQRWARGVVVASSRPSTVRVGHDVDLALGDPGAPIRPLVRMDHVGLIAMGVTRGGFRIYASCEPLVAVGAVGSAWPVSFGYWRCYPARAGRSVGAEAVPTSPAALIDRISQERTARCQHEPEGRASGSRIFDDRTKDLVSFGELVAWA